MRYRLLLLACLIAMIPSAERTFAEVVAKNLEYKDGTTVLEGVLVYDNAGTAKKPGVLVVHEQGATHANARTRAAQIARLGYVALSVDLYGKGILPKDGKDAATKLGLPKDRKLVRSRMAAALDAFGKQPNVNNKLISAIGYGTGGTAVIELARSGADIEGVVGLHCDLSAVGDDAKKISASIMAIIGGDDPFIPTSQVNAFEEEMRRGGVDWQIVKMGGIYHDFTNPQAGKDAKTGSAYDIDADKRSVDSIKTFLAEMFPPVPVKDTTTPVAPPAKANPAAPAVKGIPDKAMKVLKHVDDNGDAMEGYEGGRNFGNFEKRLPQSDKQGRRIKYREWDVNPLRPGVNRGAERLVTGSDGSAYYTDDHYDSFKKIR
jgi:dienelactone hydrolase